MEDNKRLSLRDEISVLLNKYSAENESDTPDYILAQFLIGCLGCFNDAINSRERYYGRRTIKDEIKNL